MLADAAQLVNRRVHGRIYLVDHLFQQAEIRVGVGKRRVVQITRTRDYHAVTCPGAPECPPDPAAGAPPMREDTHGDS